MLAIDTNVIVRYLTRDHPEHAARAAAITRGEPVFVSVTVILETELVLRSTYDFHRAAVVLGLKGFCGLPMVTVENAERVFTAPDLAAAGMDFADALHLCRSDECEAFVTFDRKLARAAAAAGQPPVREA